jgi:hypothetical protein
MDYKYPSTSGYMYVGGNPIMITDPTGMDWFRDIEGNVQWFENEKGDFSDIETKKEWSHIGETYELPDGSGSLGNVHFKYGEDKQLDVGSGETASPSIEIEFIPSEGNRGEYGNWVQTYFANSKPDSETLYDENLVSDIYAEYNDHGYSTLFYNSPIGCDLTGRNPLFLEDMPKRAAAVVSGKEVGMHFTSSVVITKNGVNNAVVSLAWGFTISPEGFVTFNSFRITNETSSFHKQVVKNAKR